jgi:hypothetical protein
MTVRELMEQLSVLNPDTRIFTSITDPTDYTLTLELDDVELVNELYGDNVGDDYEDMFNDEGEYKYIGEPVLLIKLES